MFTRITFRVMTTTGLKPPYYVLWVRETDAWGEEDLMYGFVHKGNSRFGHNDFKDVCVTKNQKIFFTNKVNDGESATFDECLEFLGEKQQPVGNPILLTDRIYSFAEAAKIGIEQKIFPNPAGVVFLAKRTKPPATAVLAKPGENLGLKDMLARGKTLSDELNRQKTDAGNSTSDQSLALLSGLPFVASADTAGVTVVDSVAAAPAAVSLATAASSEASSASGATPVLPSMSLSGDSNSNNSVVLGDSTATQESVDKMVLEAEIETWKRRAKEFEARYESLEDEATKLRNENTTLKTQLLSSQELQKGFMVASDKAVASNESMNADTADVVSKKVLQVLGKKLGSLVVVEAEAAKIPGIVGEVAKLDDIAATVGDLAPSLSSVKEGMGKLSGEMNNMAEFMTNLSGFMEKLSPFLKGLPSLVAVQVCGDFEKTSVEIKRGFDSVTSRINTSHESLE